MTSENKPKRPRHKPGGSTESSVKAGTAETGAPERIAKLLARAGVASRREAERMVTEGRVSVNGRVLDTPAVTASLADRIEVDGRPIRGIERTRLWLYYKPAGLVTTNRDPEGRPTVFERLPDDLPRVVTVGRLDINTEGLLLLTNDGGLARVLELPATGWLRRYRVRAHGDIDQAALDRLKEGIAVDGVLYGAIEATLDRVQGANVWITMALREGKNREIKNVLGALGLTVNRLIRLSYGPFQLADLAEGAVREIRGRTLREQLGPRLIAEAGANFEAPVFAGEQAVPEPEDKQPAVRKAGERKPRGEGKEGREHRRERALSRLTTRRSDEGRHEDRPKRRPGQRSRASNVWMAPGARPVNPKKAAAEKAAGEEAAERRSRRPASKAERFDKTIRKDGDRKPRGPVGAAARERRPGEGPDREAGGKPRAFRGKSGSSGKNPGVSAMERPATGRAAAGGKGAAKKPFAKGAGGAKSGQRPPGKAGARPAAKGAGGGNSGQRPQGKPGARPAAKGETGRQARGPRAGGRKGAPGGADRRR